MLGLRNNVLLNEINVDLWQWQYFVKLYILFLLFLKVFWQ
jgi:hypothetical protein